MQNKANRPIFVVGSPRSGTSILTWCLGQHPNIFAVPESNWMGDFVANAEAVHQVGAARGHLSILSAMDISRDELLANFGRTINDLILSHRSDLERTRAAIPSLPEFMRRSLPGAKTRWVDGTPGVFIAYLRAEKAFSGGGVYPYPARRARCGPFNA